MDNKLKVRSMDELSALFGDTNDTPMDGASGGLVELPPERLLNFRKKHPFNAYNEDKVSSMVESIKQFGVLEPIIVRPIADSEDYEIIAGHNRRDCAVAAGLATVPCIIKEVDDNIATLIMISTNLDQRDKILPSERARAYKLQYETLEAMGLSAIADEIGEAEGLKRRSVYLYLSLNNLIDELLAMIDEGQMTIKMGATLSYLAPEEQDELFSYITEGKIKLSDKQADKLKEMSSDGKWNLEKFCALVAQKPKPVATVSLRGKKLEKFFPKNTPKKEIEDLIFSLLEEHFTTKARNDNE